MDSLGLDKTLSTGDGQGSFLGSMGDLNDSEPVTHTSQSALFNLDNLLNGTGDDEHLAQDVHPRANAPSSPQPPAKLTSSPPAERAIQHNEAGTCVAKPEEGRDTAMPSSSPGQRDTRQHDRPRPASPPSAEQQQQRQQDDVGLRANGPELQAVDQANVPAAATPVDVAGTPHSSAPIASPRDRLVDSCHGANASVEEHRIPYSMGRDELLRLRTVLLLALSTVRPENAQQLAAQGIRIEPSSVHLLYSRAQLVLYYMRVHEVSPELLLELRLVELVNLMRHEPRLGVLKDSCTQLLRHGAWGARAAQVGLHPDAAETAAVDG